MKIPDKIKIGYKDYTVELLNALDDGAILLYGRIDYHKEIIELQKTYTHNQKCCTLIHEVIHGVDEMNGIGLKENQVIKLAKGLYQVIKDNPEMFN